jgi:hypothetical protein
MMSAPFVPGCDPFRILRGGDGSIRWGHSMQRSAAAHANCDELRRRLPELPLTSPSGARIAAPVELAYNFRDPQVFGGATRGTKAHLSWQVPT